MSTTAQLASFLAPGKDPRGVDFCLPQFAGGTATPLRTVASANSSTASEYSYPSTLFTNRDVQSALHVQALLAKHFDEGWIRLHSPESFVSDRRKHGARRVGILFGSRSNDALSSAVEYTRLNRLVSFDFSNDWAIIGQDGQRFSMTDPSTLSREDYEAMTDYCVIARVRADHARPLFIVAGLGGRATEGGGRYLAHHWKDLHREFGAHDFAVVLGFPPPVSPDNCGVVARYTSERRA